MSIMGAFGFLTNVMISLSMHACKHLRQPFIAAYAVFCDMRTEPAEILMLMNVPFIVQAYWYVNSGAVHLWCE